MAKPALGHDSKIEPAPVEGQSKEGTAREEGQRGTGEVFHVQHISHGSKKTWGTSLQFENTKHRAKSRCSLPLIYDATERNILGDV